MNESEQSLYRPSSSLIIATPSYQPAQTHNYEVLLFKRTPQTSYAVDHCVFPGGTLEQADESEDWLKYFREFGVTDIQLELFERNGLPERRPPPLQANKTKMSRNLSLRITAIRETFEEVGVLICRGRNNMNTIFDFNHYGKSMEDFDKVFWQTQVHNDANQFLELCKQLEVVPDIWSLYEWSVWRTSRNASKKFDTVYYFVGLEHRPQLVLEVTEVEMAMWANPELFLEWFSLGSIWLPPIIFYELSRFVNVNMWSSLLKFVYNRRHQGSSSLTLAYYQSPEGFIGTLPGDDFFTKNPNDKGQTFVIKSSLAEFRQRATNIHRIIIENTHKIWIDMNIPPPDKHLSPVLKNIPSKSKL